jgi:hypothetical protein
MYNIAGGLRLASGIVNSEEGNSKGCGKMLWNTITGKVAARVANREIVKHAVASVLLGILYIELRRVQLACVRPLGWLAQGPNRYCPRRYFLELKSSSSQYSGMATH